MVADRNFVIEILGGDHENNPATANLQTKLAVPDENMVGERLFVAEGGCAHLLIFGSSICL